MFFMANFWLLFVPTVTGVAALVLFTNKPKWNDFLAFAVIVSGLVTSYTILHPRQTPLLSEAKNVRDMIGVGTPVLLEFQSPY